MPECGNHVWWSEGKRDEGCWVLRDVALKLPEHSRSGESRLFDHSTFDTDTPLHAHNTASHASNDMTTECSWSRCVRSGRSDTLTWRRFIPRAETPPQWQKGKSTMRTTEIHTHCSTMWHPNRTNTLAIARGKSLHITEMLRYMQYRLSAYPKDRL
jgi:hypothetical protein